MVGRALEWFAEAPQQPFLKIALRVDNTKAEAVKRGAAADMAPVD